MGVNKKFSKAVLTEGIFVLVVGILILTLPQLTSIALAWILSLSLLFAGLYKLITTLTNRDQFRNPFISTLVSLLMMGAGVYLSVHPFFNLMVLTIIAGLYFILDGIGSIILAVKAKNKVKGWWMAIITAIIQFILALIIIAGLPKTAVWTIAILIGVNLIFVGIGMISIFLTIKDTPQEAEINESAE